jgi:glycosyltransferase involved in cell wall biosynthesis
MPRILYIVPSDYDALKAKGVDGMIFERDERGFFERVVTVHPAAQHNRVIKFNETFVLHELGFYAIDKGSHNKLLLALVAPIQFMRAVIKIRELIIRERIDLIRANDPFWTGMIGLAVSKLTGRRLCISIHADFDKRHQLTGGGYSYTFFGMQWPARLICRIVLSSADMVMPIRESLGRWAVSKGASRERIRVIPHGIDINALEDEADHDIRTLLNIPSGRHIISFVGRLSPENYIGDMLEMARRLSAHRNDFCLVIAGKGELEDWMKKMFNDNPSLGDVVRLVGFQPRTVCFSLRRQSAVSLCLMGGFSLIEACLARSLVVSYDVEWHNELINDGITGFLVKENDVDRLVNVVNFALDHKEEVVVMGQRAKALAVNRHDIKKTSNIKQGYYKELLDSRTGIYMKQLNPECQAATGDPWYTDSQFQAQMGTPGRRKIIENRWNIFRDMIQTWMSEQGFDHTEMRFKILDAGCGDGINLLGISEKAKENAWNFEFTGVDYNPVRVSRASERHFKIHKAFLYDLPFEDESFDIVLCNHVLEHVPDFSKSLNELYRVLKKGGLFIAGIPNEGCFMAQLRNKVIQRSILRKTDHINFFTKGSFSRHLSKAGFAVRLVKGETFFFPLSYINTLLNEFSTGLAVMSLLRRLFPSQAGGFIFSSIKRG